jgi:hypothetical protein
MLAYGEAFDDIAVPDFLREARHTAGESPTDHRQALQPQ